MREGRITAIPAKRSKRLLLLDHVAQLFEPGLRYPERDVDELLAALHDDYVSLRRYLVDEELLDRDHGIYWRIGGSTTSPAPGQTPS